MMTDRPPLTVRQQHVYDFIVARLAQIGYAPSIREMCAHLGIRSTNGVADHLKALQRKGYLTKAGRLSRTWQPLGPGANEGAGALAPTRGAIAEQVRVPVLGRVAAGEPILAEEDAADAITVDAALLPRGRPLFALSVTGKSMIEAGIFDGDVIFVDRRDEARAGQIVVALIDDEATVKYYQPERRQVRLRPANATMEDIVIRARDRRAFRVLGVVVGVFRRL